jgi:SAM-dependent methyltransferase
MIQREEYELLQVHFFQHMLKELGSEMKAHSLVLDFGCGEGWTVYQLRRQGINAFGVDIVNCYNNVQKLCKDEGIIKTDQEIFYTMDVNNYTIPFDNDTFDVVISDQVFEHVQNYPQAIAEIQRVLKPGGSSLNVIPSRYHPIEGHVFVPLATIFRGHAYLAFWAFLGIRNSYQKQLSWKEVANLNYEYLHNCTTYYTKSKIRKLFASQFGSVSFVEATFLKYHHGRIHRYLYPISKKLPIISSLFCTFHSRVVFCKKQETGASAKPLESPAETMSQLARL